MKTPFTLYFDQADRPIHTTSRCPFVAQYAPPFVAPACTAFFSSAGMGVSYRWHDAFDVFVAVVEATLDGPIAMPVASHLADLYLVYQLHGESRFVPEGAPLPSAPAITLARGQRMEVYAPPARATVQLHGDHDTGRYVAAAIVPKSGWVIRHPMAGNSPWEELLEILKQRQQAYRYLHPSPISASMYTWLHVLLSTPAYAGMRLDDALNGPMVRLLEEHRREYRISEAEDETRKLADAARLLVHELLARADGMQLLTPDEVSRALSVSPLLLKQAHLATYQHSLADYIHKERMAFAREWLATGQSVKEVGLALGYTSPSNFSRSFKRRYGVSPRYAQQKK